MSDNAFYTQISHVENQSTYCKKTRKLRLGEFLPASGEVVLTMA
jgi:hypothetical protein